MSPRRGSLLSKLTIVQVLAFGSLWLIVIALVVISMYARDRGDIDLELRQLSHSLAQLAPPGAEATEAARIGAEFAQITQRTADPPLRSGEFAYQLWSADGRLLARSTGAPALTTGAPAKASADTTPAVKDWYVRGDWNRDRSVYAVTGKSAQYYRRRVRSTVLGLAGLWLAMAVLFALAFWLSFRVVIRPMRALAKRVADRDAEDLSPIEESAAFTEVRPLLTALNQKLATIRSLLDSERQFFADAAHELRTPLSVIGAQAHVLAHEHGLPDRLTALREIEGGIDRSARAVGKLLTLARLQHRHTAVDAIPATHDLTELAASAVATFQARAAVANQSLQFEGRGPALIRCDSVQVTTLLENLIDNALRYSPAGSYVHVCVETPDGRAVIVVTDNGPGIAPEDRTRVFDRFQRLGRADAGGSGLGLAIVQRIAALHDARVQLGVGPDGRGLSVEIHFPQL